MKRATAEIVNEYGPFPGIDGVHGVTYDGEHVWFASGDKLNVLDPQSGKTLRSLDVAAHAGTAFDGQHLYQIADQRIHKIDPQTGHVLNSIPAPGGDDAAGLTWAEGSLWVGQYRDRKILQVDPETGKILRSIESNRFVTGVTWVDERALARHLGRQRKRAKTRRSSQRRGRGESRDASRRQRVRARIRWSRPVLLPAADAAASCEPWAGRSAAPLPETLSRPLP